METVEKRVKQEKQQGKGKARPSLTTAAVPRCTSSSRYIMKAFAWLFPAVEAAGAAFKLGRPHLGESMALFSSPSVSHHMLGPQVHTPSYSTLLIASLTAAAGVKMGAGSTST